ncbi:hypothetical protein XELAEV_18034040mg, partial [Xenopus laevis]
MTSASPRPGGSVEPASVLQAQAFGPSLEESLHCSSDSKKLEFGSVGEGVARHAQVELSGGHCVAVEVEAGEMEAQAPAKQTAEKKTSGGRKSEPSETRRSVRNTQRQKKVAELTPGAAEEETRTLRSGTCHGEPQGGGVSVHELQLPSSPVGISSVSQISQTGVDEYVVPETPIEDCAAGKSPAGKGEAAILSQTVRSGAAEAWESTAQDPAGNETPEPNSQLNPPPAQLTAATRGNQGHSAVAAGNVMPDTDNEAEEQKSRDSSDLSATYEPTAQRRMGAPTDVNPQLPKGKKEAEIVAQQKLIRAAYKRNKGRLELDLITLKGEIFETEVSIEKLLSKAGPWRETFENRERFEKLQKSLREEVPYRSRKLSTTSYSASSDTEGDFKKPQAPAKKAPTKSKKKDGIHWQGLAFDVQEVTEQEKKKQQREEFNIIQEDFPPLSPAAQPTKSPQAQALVSQEDSVAPMEVSSNHSAASGMSGVVHGDAVVMNDGAADA